MLSNPFRQAGLAFRRDHTLGVLLERLAEVRGDHRPGRGGRRRADPHDRRGGPPRRPVGRRGSPPGSSRARSWWWPRPTATSSCCCASPPPGPARCRRRSTPSCGRTRSPTSCPTRTPRSRSAPCRTCRAAQALGRRRPGRARRRGRALLHVGHHRQAQGRRAHPQGLLGGVMAGTLLPGGIRHDTAVVSLPMAHIMGFAVALGMACAGMPVWFLPALQPGAGARRDRDPPGQPLRRRAGHVPDAARGRRRGPRPQVGAGVGVGRRRHAGRAGRPVQEAWARPRCCRWSARVGEAAFAEGYGMVETGGGVAAKLSPPMFGRGPRLVDGHAPARLLVQGGRRRRRRGPPGRGRRAAREGTRGAHGLPGRRRGHRGARSPTTAGCAPATSPGWGPRSVVFFAGRKKDVIKHGGYSVYAVEVEQVLEQHPDVAEAAVVGLPDERKGEVPVAAVRLVDGATARRGGHAGVGRRAAQPTTRSPVRIVAVDELPRTGTNKVQRKELLRACSTARLSASGARTGSPRSCCACDCGRSSVVAGRCRSLRVRSSSSSSWCGRRR